MRRYFDDPQCAHALGNALLLLGLVLLGVGVAGGYLIDGHLSLIAQVLAHVLIILGPTLVKLGYILRINARHRLHLTY